MARWGILLVTLLVVTGCPKKKDQSKNEDMDKACKRAANRNQSPEVKRVSTLKVPPFGREFSLFNFIGHDSRDSRVSQMTFSLRNVPAGFSAIIQGGRLKLKPEQSNGEDGAKPPEGQIEIEAKDGCGATESISLSVQGTRGGAGTELFTGFGGPPSGRPQSGSETVVVPPPPSELVFRDPVNPTHRF